MRETVNTNNHTIGVQKILEDENCFLRSPVCEANSTGQKLKNRTK